MQLSITVDDQEAIDALTNAGGNIKKDLPAVVGKTSTRAKSLIARDVTATLNVRQKVVKKHIERTRPTKTTHVVSLEKSNRIPLRDFAARQNKVGVRYKIDKRKGSQVVPGRFLVDEYDGKVFGRESEARGPIDQLHGPSPWGVVVIRRRATAIAQAVFVEFKKQMQRRIEWVKLRQKKG